MKQILLFSLFAMIVCACDTDQASEPTAGASTTESESKTQKKKRNSKKRDPMWVMTVDGIPELSGHVVRYSSKAKDGIGGTYALSYSGRRANVVMIKRGEVSYLSIEFKELKVACGNWGVKIINIEGTRVELSGNVRCRPTNDGKSEERIAQLNGWFETKK